MSTFSNTAQAGSAEQPLRTPVLVFALALATTMLAVFIHLLNTQLMRGEQLRQAQRDGVVSLHAVSVGKTQQGPHQPVVVDAVVHAVRAGTAGPALQR
jgi:hypothetical protein